jgi:crotonobetainyl-CoA:carnitine CoA-transferase CaiB-like acyl-CoA transferase
MRRDDLLTSIDFMNPGWRIENNAEVDAVVERWTVGRSVVEILENLDEADITCGPIRTIDDVVAWDHLRARGMLQPVLNPHFPDAAGPLAAGFPLKFSGAEVGHDQRVPMPRQHNTEIYEGLLKLSNDEVDALSKRGIV